MTLPSLFLRFSVTTGVPSIAPHQIPRRFGQVAVARLHSLVEPGGPVVAAMCAGGHESAKRRCAAGQEGPTFCVDSIVNQSMTWPSPPNKLLHSRMGGGYPLHSGIVANSKWVPPPLCNQKWVPPPLLCARLNFTLLVCVFIGGLAARREPPILKMARMI